MTDEERSARISRMRRGKRRQEFVRRHYKKLAAAGACGLLLIILLFIFIPRISPQGTADAADEPRVQEPVSEEIAEEEPEETEDVPEESEEDEYADAEYGPYADVKSEDASRFFEGYEISITGSEAYPPEDEVMSTHAILLNAATGEVVAAKDAGVRIYPASMTKILTLLVAAEHVTDLDDTFLIDISITDYAYSHDCSAVGFAQGEIVSVRDLMYGTILPSGADAALALAEYVGGSHDRFVEMMNDKLEELGLSDTAHFTNCVGVYDDDHYCTLSDMAMIMKAAVENDLARQILNAHIYTTSSTPEHPDGIEISNWFLRRIEDKDTGGTVECAKTGFVQESGCCGASYEITDDGGVYICVTADAWSSWRCIYDHVALYSKFT